MPVRGRYQRPVVLHKTVLAAMGARRESARSRPAALGRRLRRVVVLIDTSRGYGRGLLCGVSLYNREHGRWTILFKPHALDAPSPPWLREAQADGILVRIGNDRMARAIVKSGVPAVDLRGLFVESTIPSVGVDNREVARLGAEHLLERRFQQFGFCGLPQGTNAHIDELRELFVAEIARAGFQCDVFEARRGPRRGEAWETQQSRLGQWRDQQRSLVQWIRKVPKPVAVMACHDDRALQVLEACREARVVVPEQAAVISSDNDEYLCELANPPLTSIDENPTRIGYEAAGLLDRMMDGKPPQEKRLLIPPLGVVTRQSTDLLAVADPHVARALSFIREHACDGIRPKDVVDQSSWSRVTLASRFKAAVGRTIGAEIQRVQVRLVEELLAETDLPIKQVARRAGFHHVEYMTRLFHRLTGHTPARYRRQARGR